MRIVCIFLLSASTSATAAQSALVAAASSLRTVWPGLSTAYVSATDRPAPKVSFASSGLLSTQIQHGAPFQIFISADENTINRLHSSGKIRSPSVLWAEGEIRLATLPGSDRFPHLSTQGFSALPESTMRTGFKLAIPNPVHAPYGVAARQALSAIGVWPLPEGQILAAENAAQSVQFLRTGAVDAAIVPWSLVVNNNQLKLLKAPPGSYDTVKHVASRINTDSDAADHFYDWLTSSAAVKKQLQLFGFNPIMQTLTGENE